MPFKALIYKVGINAVVDVPKSVTAKMKSVKGYILVTGKINGHSFKQPLTSLKDGNFRLYVNIPMLKGGKSAIGEMAKFTLKQDKSDRTKDYPMVAALKKELKSDDTVRKNVERVIRQLKGKNERRSCPIIYSNNFFSRLSSS